MVSQQWVLKDILALIDTIKSISTLLVEISLATHSSILLLEGHCSQQLHGLTVNPIVPNVFATSGDDGFLKFWDISSRNCLRRFNIEYASRCIAWSPCGKFIIVGLGGNPSQTSKDGNKIRAIILVNLSLASNYILSFSFLKVHFLWWTW